MTRHEQVLAIGREIIGVGVTYSEESVLSRRLKYMSGWSEGTKKKLRVALDNAGLQEVQIKQGIERSWFNGMTLLEPIAWFYE